VSIERTARDGLALEERSTPKPWRECRGRREVLIGDDWATFVNEHDAVFIAFAANHWRETAEAVIAMERVVEAAKAWQAARDAMDADVIQSVDRNARTDADLRRDYYAKCQALTDALAPTTTKQGADDAG